MSKAGPIEELAPGAESLRKGPARPESFTAKLKRLREEAEAELKAASTAAEALEAPAPETDSPPPPRPGDTPAPFRVVIGAGSRPADIRALLADVPAAPLGDAPPPPSPDAPAAPSVFTGDGRTRDILSLLKQSGAPDAGAVPPAPVAAAHDQAAPIVVRAGHRPIDILSLLTAPAPAVPPPEAPPAPVNALPPRPGPHTAPVAYGPALLTPHPPERLRRFALRRHRHADLPPAHPHHRHRALHLRERPEADERFTRRLTFAGAAVILPALALGWRHLVPDDARMVDRLVTDGRLKEAAEISNRIAGNDSEKGGPDYRFLAAAMLVEKATGGDSDERRAAFAQVLDFARRDPADPLAASTTVKAMAKLAVCDGADALFAAGAPNMPAHIATLWVEGLVERHFADANPDAALRAALIGWDAAPGRAVSAEFLLRVARQANKAAAVTSRLREHVVVGARFDLADVYRTAMREAGHEADALRELWPVLMLRIRPADFEGLARSILACGPAPLAAETADLLDRALKAPDLPLAGGVALITLCHSRSLLEPANALVDKLDAAAGASPEFLRAAARTKLWTDRPGLALVFSRRAFDATGDDADFHEALRIATALGSSRDIVALCERRDKALSPVQRALYADSLTGLGEYEGALRAFLAGNPSDVPTLAKVARLRRALRLNEDALDSYRRLVAADPRNPEWRDREFRLLVLLGRDAEAAKAAEAAWFALREPSRLNDALRACVAAGDPAETVRIAELTARAARTAEPQALLDACRFLQQARREAPRLVILRALAERFPERADIARELAVHDFNHGRFHLVERRFADTPALLETRAGAALLLTARLAGDDRTGARELLENTLRAHPDWPDYEDFAEVATRACVALRLHDTADELAPRFIARRAGSHRFRVLATRLLELRGRHAEALPLFGELGERLSPDLRLDYARSLAASGRFAEAESQMLRALAAAPSPDPRTLGALGDLRLAAGAAEPARDAYRQALGLLEAKR